MFDLRLGLALGKTKAEIRAMPYPDYHEYELFYLLEPWGWHDREYRTAALLAMLRNTNVAKERDRKPVGFFVRNLLSDLVRTLTRKPKRAPELTAMTNEERRAYLKAAAMRTFGVNE